MFVWNKLFFYLLSFCLREYRYDASVFATLAEVYDSVCKSVKSIILTDTYIQTWVVLCATLTNDDVTSDNLLTTPNLNA